MKRFYNEFYGILFGFLLCGLLGFAEITSAQPLMNWMPDILSESTSQAVYLPDYSYAGYRWGEQSFPEFETMVNVQDYGAIPNDGDNDTDALLKALKKAHQVDGPVTLYLPKGRYILTDILYLERSNIIIKGDGSGPDGTIIYCPLQLSELPTPADMKELEEYLHTYHKKQNGVPYSLYAWSGGFIWPRVKGKRVKAYMEKYNTKPDILTKATTGERGGHWLVVTSPKSLNPGDMVKLNLFNREGEHSSLIDHIYDNQAGNLKVGVRHWQNPDIPLVSQEVTVQSVSGDTIWLKEPLLNDVRPEWTPTITAWPHHENVGIEHLRFEFPKTTYRLHHVERGYNAIYLTSLSHSWVYDVNVHNGDSGVLTDDCANVTIQDVGVSGTGYHYGVMMGEVHNILANNIRINADCVHSLSFNTGATNCVFTHCQVNVSPRLDQHSGANYQNLFDDIRVKVKSPDHEYIDYGGAGYWKPSAGAFTTFWNIAVDYTFEHPHEDTLDVKGVPDGPSARLIGVHANYPIKISYRPNAYFEGINRNDCRVPSLYDYQLAKRLGKI